MGSDNNHQGIDTVPSWGSDDKLAERQDRMDFNAKTSYAKAANSGKAKVVPGPIARGRRKRRGHSA
jgi:hypothetical protein